jgi:hypothetical protein
MEIDTTNVILIVVGAHLKAEAFDRASAYLLRDRMQAWLAEHGEPRDPARVIVCSDVWYLNNEDLRDRPTVSIGAPGVSALGAFLADRLPSALAVDDALMVQGDPAWDTCIASCWGVDHERTAAAVQAFIERYLDGFMDRAAEE